MTSTTTTSSATTQAPARRVPGPLVALVGGALALALGRATTTPGGSPAQRLDQMTGNDVRVTASALLVIAGFVAIVPGFWFVAGTVRRRGARGARLGLIGSWLVLVGSVGFSVLASVDLATLAATHVGDRATMTSYLHEIDVSPGILALTVPALVGYFVGPFLVALAARRSGIGPKLLPAAVLASLFLQPIGAGLGGPPVARVADLALQLVLVATTIVLGRAVTAAGDVSGAEPGSS